LTPLRLHPLAIALAVAFSVASLSVRAADTAAPAAPAASAAPAAPMATGAVPGLDLSGMDAAARPQDDLFRAMNGTWIKNTQIPADKADFGTFIQLRDLSDQRVKGIVEALGKEKAKPGSVDQKIGDFYNAYMDTAAIDKAGLAPLKAELHALDAVKDRKGLVAVMGRWQSVVALPMGLGAGQDFKNPDTYTPFVFQGGLGMPNRDYYLKDTERFQKVRTAYMAYLTRLFVLSGDADADAAAHAKQVYDLEHQIAEVQWPTEDNRDPQKIYNPTKVSALVRDDANIDWKGLLKTAQMPTPGDILVVGQPSYFKGLSGLMGSVPLDTWKRYLKIRLIDGLATELPAAYREAHFDFSGRAIGGKTEDLPRWQKAVNTLNGAMGEALGQVYVQQYFPPAYKQRMTELVKNLLATYSTSIDGLTWMSPATKKAAHEKLAKYGIKIGYPDVWRDYSSLVVKAGDPIGNDFRASRFEFMRQAVRVGKKVDRKEWGMTPQTVNAYYDPSMNEIVFPAAILQPPFFDMGADDAVNYGAIGAVIGHEISHGFDDEGSQFDGDGKLRNWWTDADRKAFEAITAKLVDQYAQYEPIKGSKLNGKLTLGENIADLSGLQIAYKAWKMSLNGKPAPVIGGLTGDQRFFLSWSQAWRDKSREERSLQLLTVDPHSPAEFRANGAAINHDAFHQAFGTKPGDAMWKAPEERLHLW
jgi:putative endopeptidase